MLCWKCDEYTTYYAVSAMLQIASYVKDGALQDTMFRQTRLVMEMPKVDLYAEYLS